jgi:hypothetical protein
MYDGKKITVGLVLFLGLMTLPFWHTLGKPIPAPQISLDTPQIAKLQEKRCLEPNSYMRVSHMKFLRAWKNTVTRKGNRIFVSSSGKEVTNGFPQACLSCHSNKEQFCDRCHEYVGARTNCYHCHVIA